MSGDGDEEDGRLAVAEDSGYAYTSPASRSHPSMVREPAFENIDDAARSLSDLFSTTVTTEEMAEEECAFETIEEGDEDLEDTTGDLTADLRRHHLASSDTGESLPDEKRTTPKFKLVTTDSGHLLRIPSVVEPESSRKQLIAAMSMDSSDGDLKDALSLESIDDDAEDDLPTESNDDPRKVMAETPSGSSQILFQSNRRMSLTMDLETGQEGGARTHCAMIRDSNMCSPQSVGTRRRQVFKTMMTPTKRPQVVPGKEYIRNSTIITSKTKNDDVLYLPGAHSYSVRPKQVEVEDGSGDESVKIQYTLKGAISSKPAGPIKRVARFLGVSSGTGIYEEAPHQNQPRLSFCGFQPNQFVVNYLNWAFRSSFPAVFFSAAMAFIIQTVFFTLLIMLTGSQEPQCIHVNGIDYNDSESPFWDAYALSWTTFSTVGYGLIFPSTTATSVDVKGCVGITILTTFESFVGILFGSLWGAILFAKVSRTLSFAQVTFSDPIVIRYGSGVATAEEDDKSSNAKGEGSAEIRGSPKTSPKNLPCPLLEFRVINNLHGQRGGEIIDASMNIVASIDEKHASRGIFKASRESTLRGKKRRRKRVRQKTNDMFQSFRLSSSSSKGRGLQRTNRMSMANLFASVQKPKAQIIDEDPTGKIVPKRVFCKLTIESPEHPFFKRIWIARHVLDHHSPLLTHEARERVRLNGGHWPQELNNAEAVRSSIHFHKILVSLSGTSNVDANSVYAQHVYDFVDLCVGYRFCDILFRHDSDGSLGLDPTLLNDVREQMGGGGEPLTRQKDKQMADIFIL